MTRGTIKLPSKQNCGLGFNRTSTSFVDHGLFLGRLGCGIPQRNPGMEIGSCGVQSAIHDAITYLATYQPTPQDREVNLTRV